MFETLSERLSGIFDKLTGRGALSEADVDEAMREVRRALLEADVALEVVRAFIDKVKGKAVGAQVVKSVTPGQMVVKIVHDGLVEMLGSEGSALNLRSSPPVPILMVGLQGSGKTTTTAKIAKRLKERDKRRVLMASLDTRRPAAQEQLAVLGQQTQVDTLAIIKGETPIQIARRAMSEARRGGYDVVMLDTAGRLHIDDELLAEAAAVRDIARPQETLLVADALTGQDAVNLARSFDDKIGISGIVGMLPGMGKVKKQLKGVDLDNTVLKRQMAIISSMTAFEKRNPKVMNASRKKRVAQGSGTKVEEINRLLKMHLQMADMMKKMGQGKGLFGKMFGGGAAPDAAELEKMQAEFAKLDPN